MKRGRKIKTIAILVGVIEDKVGGKSMPKRTIKGTDAQIFQLENNRAEIAFRFDKRSLF